MVTTASRVPPVHIRAPYVRAEALDAVAANADGARLGKRLGGPRPTREREAMVDGANFDTTLRQMVRGSSPLFARRRKHCIQ
jgi:hypothetical protein